MSVSDRWHKSRPKPGEPKCREHDMSPSRAHGKGDRWQVRWRDENGKQGSRNFARKTGKDPERHADAFDAQVKSQMDAGTYIDPAAGKVLLRARGDMYVKALTVDESTRDAVAARLRLHVYPELGSYEMRSLARSPSVCQAWMRGLQATLAPSYIRIIRGALSAIFDTAVDDGIISRNPLRAGSVKAPRMPKRKIEPWTEERVEAVTEALAERFAAMADLASGTGMRQGELFGFAQDDVNWLAARKLARVRRQVKIVRGALVFAPPKGDRDRDVPMADPVALRLSQHLEQFPAVTVTLPWKVPGGKPVTARLMFTSVTGKALARNDFNRYVWKPALERAGVIQPRAEGVQAWGESRENGMHALRHFYASALLADGVDIPGRVPRPLRSRFHADHLHAPDALGRGPGDRRH